MLKCLMFTDIFFFEVSDHTSPFIVQKGMESWRLSRRGAWTQWSVFTVLSVKGQLTGIWDGCLEWQEICRLNEITSDTLLCFLKEKGDTVRTCEVTRNRVTVKYSYTRSRGRKHYIIIHESQLTGESWSETEFWLVCAKLLQELNFLYVFFMFSRFILLFPSSHFFIRPSIPVSCIFLIFISIILYILFITTFLLKLPSFSFSVIPFFSLHLHSFPMF